MKDNQQVIDEVFALYQKFGNEDYIGEPVSQIEHMSQSGELARLGGFDDEVIIASFFHDIGHFVNKNDSMDGYGTVRHEKLGADFLRDKGFPEKVAVLVENHVQAKRYLTYKSQEYYNSLSEASKKTLEFQGGRMTKEEAERFEKSEFFQLSIKMRQWDELAKEENIPLPDIEIYKNIALNVLNKSI